MVGYGAKHSKCNHMMTPGFKGLMLSKVKARTGQTDRQTDATKDIIKPHSRTIIVISCQLSVLYLIHRAWFQNHEHQSKAVEIYNFAGLIAAVTVVFIFPWFHAIPSHLRGFSRGDFTIRLQLRATKRRGRHKFVNFRFTDSKTVRLSIRFVITILYTAVAHGLGAKPQKCRFA